MAGEMEICVGGEPRMLSVYHLGPRLPKLDTIPDFCLHRSLPILIGFAINDHAV